MRHRLDQRACFLAVLHGLVVIPQLPQLPGQPAVTAQADVNAAGYCGMMPLHLALFRGQGKVVPLLIEKGADVNSQNNFYETPLFLAAREGLADMVELLVSKGSESNPTAAFGPDSKTLLHAAAQGGCKNFAERIIAQGADVNASEMGTGSPLFGAALI